MTQQLIRAPVEVNDLAEGSPGGHEMPDPPSPLKTSTIPAIIASDVEREMPASETGVVSALDLRAEHDSNNDAQDASLTTDEAKTTPIPQKSARLQAGEAPRVLIIEDTTELAEVIQATLERMNMITAHETHGNKALEKLHEMDPDVVLLDISLPDMTGWKILDVIKETGERTGVMPVVIVITAYGDPANRLVGKLQGVHSYLIKPFTSDEIEKIVSQALNSPTK